MRRGLRVLVCIAALSAAPAQANDAFKHLTVAPADYDTLAHELNGRITFDTLPVRAEPGHLIEGLFSAPGVLIGERFEGQKLLVARNTQNQRFDALSKPPTAPLLIRPGKPGETLSIATHRGFGSMAAFALGPEGFPDIKARGEGALTIFFETDQRAFGLLLHADYDDPLGARPAPGTAVLHFYGRDGTLLGHHTAHLSSGIRKIAVRFNFQGLAGVTLTTTDPGGLAVDDILYTLPAISS